MLAWYINRQQHDSIVIILNFKTLFTRTTENNDERLILVL